MLHLTQKIAVAAGALTLAAGGVAAAVTPPEAADAGLTTAEEQVGVDLPASKDAHPGAPTEDTSDSEAEVEETTELEEPEVEGTGPVDNHGAVVSVVAQDDSTSGREHGEAVSAVARDNHGAETSAAARPDAGEHGRP